jgi:rhamnosyltransferase
MIKIATIITLYHPQETIFRNIKKLLPLVSNIYLVINSPLKEKFTQKLLSIPKVTILHNKGNNLGIAKALNKGLEQAKKDHISWLLTMDQDSYFEKEDLTLLLQEFKQLPKEELLIFSPIHNNKFLQKNTQTNIQEIDFIMTSGNIVNVDLAYKIGKYNEELFIDEVDHDFCFRAKIHNYKIFQCTSIALQHTLGVPHSKYASINIYPPIRLYYMIRNYLYIRKRYKKKDTLFFKKRDFYLIKFFLKQLIFGSKRKEKVFMIVQGIYSFYTKQFGAYPYA